MDIQGLHQLIGYLREDFKSFQNNEFHSLQLKVDKLAIKVALIVGAISALTLVGNVLIRVL